MPTADARTPLLRSLSPSPLDIQSYGEPRHEVQTPDPSAQEPQRPLQPPPQISQLGIRVDAQRIAQVDVDALLLQSFRELHDAVPR